MGRPLCVGRGGRGGGGGEGVVCECESEIERRGGEGRREVKENPTVNRGEERGEMRVEDKVSRYRRGSERENNKEYVYELK